MRNALAVGPKGAQVPGVRDEKGLSGRSVGGQTGGYEDDINQALRGRWIMSLCVRVRGDLSSVVALVVGRTWGGPAPLGPGETGIPVTERTGGARQRQSVLYRSGKVFVRDDVSVRPR